MVGGVVEVVVGPVGAVEVNNQEVAMIPLWVLGLVVVSRVGPWSRSLSRSGWWSVSASRPVAMTRWILESRSWSGPRARSSSREKTRSRSGVWARSHSSSARRLP